MLDVLECIIEAGYLSDMLTLDRGIEAVSITRGQA